MRVTLGVVIRSLVKIGLFDNSSQMIVLKGLRFSRFDGGHPGVVIKRYGEDRSKTLLVWLFFSKISWLESQLYT